MPEYSFEVLASGSYVPKRIVTNGELAIKFATSDSWIREKIGIHERHYASDNEGVSDMALIAARKALEMAALTPSDLDAIVFATATPEYAAPGSGVLLQQKLGARQIPAFDIRNTSPGFLYSLDVATGLLASNRYNKILVVGSEIHSRILDFSDAGRMMSVIFGDGCGCMLLGKSPVKSPAQKKGWLDFVLHSDGNFFDKLWMPANHPEMDGRTVFSHAVAKMSESIEELLNRNGLALNDIDLFISHQANLRIIEAIGAKLSLPPEKTPHNIEKYGNTSSASIPLLYDELSRAGKIKPGMKIVVMSFGSGFCWGAGLLSM